MSSIKDKISNDLRDNTTAAAIKNTSSLSQNKQSSALKGPDLPSLSLPKGGGSIRGIGEKFAVDSASGTGSIAVPIYSSPGRSGFGPTLSISYNSGSGNGPFGFGWSMSIPSITRKTDKGLPKYQDADESDTFILSGTEDLVPVLVQDSDGKWSHKEVTPRKVKDAEYKIELYRPRIEGLFARIERWTNMQTGEIHWRSISKDNITAIFGKNSESRIADPTDPTHRIFSWLICESYDDRGNVSIYNYKAENSEGVVDLSLINEQNRSDLTRSANRYLKRIKYGNRKPHKVDGDNPLDEGLEQELQNEWMFEVVFDYGEHYFEDRQTHLPISVFIDEDQQQQRQWQIRQDPFSRYRAGFEVRTYRLCRRVLMFHHFPDEHELGVQDYLVKSTEFAYGESPAASFITKITQSSYLLKDGKYLKKSLPSLEFGYSGLSSEKNDPEADVIGLGFEFSPSAIQDKIQEIDAESLQNLPNGLDGMRYQWVDLDGEGISGILTEQDGAWFYKHNISSLPLTGPDGKLILDTEGKPVVVAHFQPLTVKITTPSFSDLTSVSSKQHQLMDITGEGIPDLVKFDRFISGYFKRSSSVDTENWETFTPFPSLPNISWNDPNLRFIDLTGNGHADILITEDQAFSWYPSLAEKGFGQQARRIYQPLDDEKGPRLVFAEVTQSIYLADMSGDGLADLVRIRNGEVCYWPNLGYGNFGVKVALQNSPCFDTPDLFDPQRIRLADIDGSGTTDIIYLGCDGIHLYFNQSGNTLSSSQTLNTQFPHIDQLSSVMAVDLLGNGTSCLVWSSPLPGDTDRSMRYIDFMRGQKPHLLISVVNNMGSETKIQYSPSTKFYLDDKIRGQAWITKLPFPVQLVERVETHDRISKNMFVTRYTYHHGYFDPVECEFRGFGMVEQFDTEEFAALSKTGVLPSPTNVNKSSHIPPVKTKTWFHTGAYLDGYCISNQFEHEYYREPALSDEDYHNQLLSDSTILIPKKTIITADEEREAFRALKGSILRQEIYALDNIPNKSENPYSVSEWNYTVNCIQPQNDNKNFCHAVFFVHSREVVDYYYERNPDDPRISHSLTLEVDKFGNALRSAFVGYGRTSKKQDPILSNQDQIKQSQLLITCTEKSFTNPIIPIKPDHSDGDIYRTPLPCESSTYELTGLNPVTSNRFDFATIDHAVTNAVQIDYQEKPSSSGGGLQKRLIEHSYILYRKDDLDGPLSLGEIEPLGLIYETYKQAFTPGLVSQVYGNRVTDSMLLNEGRYVHFKKDLSSPNEDPNWWIPSGRIFYSLNEDDSPADELKFAVENFFLPHRFRDPFHNATSRKDSKITYDQHKLLIQETHDPLDNVVTAVTKDKMDKTVIALDYRVLQPWLVTDPNDNRSAIAYDILGLVVGTAVMGKIGENKGDSLDGFDSNLDEATIISHIKNPLTNDPHDILNKATTCLIYDLFQYKRSSETSNSELLPNVVYSLIRETHDSDLVASPTGGHIPTKIQHIFSYSDGFGREIQKKIQAEPGKIDDNGDFEDPRWIGSGWTIFNNKGKPVKKYEPFFSDTHHFQFAKIVGVSPTLFYDPVGRVVAILHPNHTYEKIVFDSWSQESWDVNDTVLQTDPKDDLSVKSFFERLPDSEYLKTWHEDRKNGQKGLEEQDAAKKASAHANTPSVSYFDSLGRIFVTIANNGEDGKYNTRIEVDIEGNQREVMNVINTLDRKVMVYDYDMLRNRIRQASMDAGQRWTMNNVEVNPIYMWDSRDHIIRSTYDEIQRPTGLLLRKEVDTEELMELTIFGEVQGKALNYRGKIFKHFDEAGVVTNQGYDFKGNLLESTRQLAADYKNTLDWTMITTVQLEVQTFSTSTTFDALNRVMTITSPDNSITHYIYNETNLLKKLEVNLRGKDKIMIFVNNVEYNARGQQVSIEYGNGIITKYEYDDLTFRLIHLQTNRGSEKLQDLFYTYDPIGNITHIKDNSDIQNVIFFRNHRVEPSSDYTYDAVYQLKIAKGREHLGQIGDKLSPVPTSSTDEPRVNLNHPNDSNAMGTYLEEYKYDEIGNIKEINHQTDSEPSKPGWTRFYAYNEPSLIDASFMNNRLSSTIIKTTRGVNDVTENYRYDVHGNIVSMPHLHLMRWDFRDQLQATSQQKVEINKTPIITYYVYNSSGQRIRKVTESEAKEGQEPRRQKDRIYLGGSEMYREYNGNNGNITKLMRETLHIMANKQRIALVDTLTQDIDNSLSQTVRYHVNNHLGSCCLELNESSEIISYEEYYPYGSTSYQASQTFTEAKRKRYRYIDKERDDETGFYYHQARYYAQWLGRWISCDPMGVIDGLNIYAYVSNNPIKYSDPLGTQGTEGDVWLNPYVSLARNPPLSESGLVTTGEISVLSGEDEEPPPQPVINDEFNLGISPTWLKSQEAAEENNDVLATAGAARPELARLGIVATGGGDKETKFAKREYIKGLIAGGHDSLLGGILVYVGLALYSVGRKELAQNFLERPQTNTELSRNTAFITSSAIDIIAAPALEEPLGALQKGLKAEGLAMPLETLAIPKPSTNVRVPGRNTLTASEAENLQAIAAKYKTEIDVVGSRAAGRGRNIDTDLPVGKDPFGAPRTTRSDIDVRISGEADIASGGMLSNDISNASGGAGNIVSSGLPEIASSPPFIKITPTKIILNFRF